MNKTGHKGFTIVELLIAISISTIVMLSAVTIFSTQNRMKKTHEQVVETQQNLRSALYLLERDIRIAGYRGNATNVSFGSHIGFVDTCDAQTLTFTYLTDTDPDDKDGDGITDEPALTKIEYAVVAGNLIRTEDDVNQETIAENIDDIEFFYTMVDSTNTITQKKTPTATDLPLVRSVAVSILAKSRKAVNVSTSGHSFTTASGVPWNNFNDNFFRRFARSSVICRNLQNGI